MYDSFEEVKNHTKRLLKREVEELEKKILKYKLYKTD